MNQVTSRAPDRRTRKSRAALQQALLSLIATRPYDAITIEDVTEEADVARATFYAHYKDKSALLNEASSDLLSELTERLTSLAPAEDMSVYTGAAVFELFRHAEEHRDLYLLLISGDGVRAARRRLVAALEATALEIFARVAAAPAHRPRVPLEATSRAYVGGLLLTLERWLEDDHRATVTAVAGDLLRVQAGGLEWSLGYEPGGTRFEPQVD